ncbi:CAZyme family GH71 [Penicillium atrosanguineum]|nr:CAZyme family GH71 [Penicillium atrosanguineum]
MVSTASLLVSIYALGLWAAQLANASHYSYSQTRQETNRLVFAHYMVGVTSNRRTTTDWDEDMQRANQLGIDAFALNIGVDSYTDQQLGFAYQSAARNSMKVFLSFDFNWWSTSQAAEIGEKDCSVFVSSFAGDGLDVGAVRGAAGVPIFFAPNFHPGSGADITSVDGLFNWMSWANNGRNKAPTQNSNISVSAGDQAYLAALAGRAYIAPVSPWFFTHYGPEVSYSKNWVFPSDLLWYNRWRDLLALQPRFIEIVTWNDYGESHYTGPLHSLHTDDGSSKWVNDMPHGGWLEMAQPFIKAFKAGASSPNRYITSDQLIYWYRPTLRNQNCDPTDTCMIPADNSSGNYFLGRPDGWESLQDAIFVVSLLQSPALVQINSGGKLHHYTAPAGAFAQAVQLNTGPQTFSVHRNGQTILVGTSLKQVINGCVCGLYNFNAYGRSYAQSQPWKSMVLIRSFSWKSPTGTRGSTSIR